MKMQIPNSTALQAFEAAARHESFTRAAVELCVTQGAISRHIALLEQFVGVSLFERVQRRVVLTDAGATYLRRVRPALSELASASTELMVHRGRGGRLGLASLPTFNARWLVPRLARFNARHPEVQLDFVPHSQGYDFARPDLDCAIRFGEGVWPGAAAVYIAGREVVPVVASRLWQREDQRNLARLTLLHHSSVERAWPDWLRAAGRGDLNGNVGPRFDQYSVLIQAAVAGLGAALVPRCLVEEELQKRQLKIALKLRHESPRGYYLCYPESRQAWPPLAAFRSWLEKEVHEAAAATGNAGDR
jgi:LysR family glycine cleavage system transcriptional activator